MEKLICPSESQTKQAAAKLAKRLHGGAVLALYGELGAGKTKFIQGLAEALGIKSRVTSPTFNILRVYSLKGRKDKADSFYHIDAYRLASGRDLLALGAEEFLGAPNSIAAIEWAERVEDILPPQTIRLRFRLLAGGEREITVK